MILHRFFQRFLLLVALVAPAAGLAADNDYPFDIPKKHPAMLKAWRDVTPAKFKTTAWVWSFAGTATPLEARVVGGKAFVLGTVCKPHDCGDNRMSLLIAKDGSAAYGLLKSPTLGGMTLIGAPPAEVLAILKAAL